MAHKTPVEFHREGSTLVQLARTVPTEKSTQECLESRIRPSGRTWQCYRRVHSTPTGMPTC